ncbi:MAG: Flavin-dependent oxidoreductase, luciferase family [Chloroflexi bacterium]|jgi:alkanesulfonate monooxygenase SsuD/methylene tetrahydromethanopterin reductase-like flavin-dependent oxidoreductase (luciferase family)|nr:MAG: Flavin-dependent oxidoreductase, luciferase family [Chloroflexota bacterium]
MAALDFGIWDQYRYTEIQAAASAADVYESHIRLAQLMEKVGFKQYHTIEHQGSYVGQIASPTVLLAAIAQHTTNLRLGTMIWQTPFHNPMRLAQEITMLDNLSRGRVEFGTGIGIHEHEFIRWGMDFTERQKMGEEALDIIKMAWTQERVTYHGKYWQFEEALPAPAPYQKPHPPIWAAAHSPRALAFAARNNYDVAQNIDIDSNMVKKFDYFRQVWKECGHPGPMPRTLLMRTIYVAETDEKARAEAEAHVPIDFSLGREFVINTRVGMGTSPRGVGNEITPDIQERGRVFREVGKSYDFAVDNGIAVVGSPETVIKKIKEQQESMGLNVYIGNFHVGAMPMEQVTKSLKLFGEEVIPAFK